MPYRLTERSQIPVFLLQRQKCNQIWKRSAIYRFYIFQGWLCVCICVCISVGLHQDGIGQLMLQNTKICSRPNRLNKVHSTSSKYLKDKKATKIDTLITFFPIQITNCQSTCWYLKSHTDSLQLSFFISALMCKASYTNRFQWQGKTTKGHPNSSVINPHAPSLPTSTPGMSAQPVHKFKDWLMHGQECDAQVYESKINRTSFSIKVKLHMVSTD